MDTHLVTHQFNLQKWMGIIRECRASGIPVKQWCQEHKVSIKSYYYWLHKIKSETLEQVQSEFVELDPVPRVQPAAPGTGLTLRVGDVSIDILPDTDPGLITRALEAVRRAQ